MERGRKLQLLGYSLLKPIHLDMKLSLFIVATAVLAAVNVSALPAQQADNSINANMK